MLPFADSWTRSVPRRALRRARHDEPGAGPGLAAASRSRSLLPLAALFLCADPASAQVTTRVNVNSLGVPARGGSAHDVDISADGRFVAFDGSDPLLDFTPIGNGVRHAFVHDRWTGETERVSVSSSGVQANSTVFNVSMSADGRYVCFDSDAYTLVPGDSGNVDVFVHDRRSATTIRASVTATGAQADGSVCRISPCGRYVLFVAESSHLVPGDTNDLSDLFLKDLATGDVERVNVSSSGEQAYYYPGLYLRWMHEISSGGRFVAFASLAGNLAPGAGVVPFDVFLRDRITGTTTLLSADAQGNPPNGESAWPSISADGRFVVFASAASNLVPGDTNGLSDVFLRDLQAGTIERISLGPGGLEGDDHSGKPRISPDGSKVLYWSEAGNLFPQHPDWTKLILRDRLTGSQELASVGTAGQLANGWLGEFRLSGDGAVIAFASAGSNLVAGDVNQATDAFVRDTNLSCPPISTYCGRKLNSADCRPTISTSGIPTLTGHDTFFVTAALVLNNENGLLFWGLTSQNVPFAGGRLCLQGQVVRTAGQSSQGSPPGAGIDCSGWFTFPFDQAYMAAHGLTAGTTVYGQYWYRDPGYAPPNDVGLTNGIAFTVCN